MWNDVIHFASVVDDGAGGGVRDEMKISNQDRVFKNY